ncbi:heparinase II/III family protein [Paenibacillus sp. strain BS8-2]
MEWGQKESRSLFELLSDRVRGFELIGGPEKKQEMVQRLRGDQSLAAMLDEIEAEAERLLAEAEPILTDQLFRLFGETGERLPYEHVYFAKRKRLNAFALMTWLKPETGTGIYADGLRQIVRSICDEWTWVLPAHFDEERGPWGYIDLFAAETGQALTEVAVLLGDVLGEDIVARIAEEVEQRIFEPFMSKGPYRWEKLANNWSSVCAGSIGMAAIYVVEDTERLATLLERVHAAMDAFLSGYGQDGACLEGYSYWQYGFGYYIYYMDLLKAATSGRLDGFAERKVEAIAMFQQRCFTSEDMVVSFSDSPERSGVYMGMTNRLRREFPSVASPDILLRVPYATDHCGRWAHAFRNVIWATDSTGAAANEMAGSGAVKVGWPAETRLMEDAQWFISRIVPGKGDSYCFAAKGGHNGEPHNHNDGGQFLLHANGEAYLADLGSGMYTKSYFGPERYSYWCNGSQGHSVPIVNGAYQAEGKDRKATIIDAMISEAEDHFAVELKRMYPESAGLQSFERKFRWCKLGSPALTISDRFSVDDHLAEASLSIVERFITRKEPRMLEEGFLVLEQNYLLMIRYDSDCWRPVVEQRKDFDHFGQERHWYTLDFLPTEAWRSHIIEAEFTFTFLPEEDAR